LDLQALRGTYLFEMDFETVTTHRSARAAGSAASIGSSCVPSLKGSWMGRGVMLGSNAAGKLDAIPVSIEQRGSRFGL
jgi:hypothetical protein